MTGEASEQRVTYRPRRVTWCRDTSGYADEERCGDEYGHDHYDLAVDDESGKVLYRIDPVGTTYLLEDQSVMRLIGYLDDVMVDPMILDSIIPSYNYWAPTGGAAVGVQEWHHDGGLIWDGANLRPGVWRIIPVAPERAVPGSVYVRPNGEMWRLRDYVPDWTTGEVRLRAAYRIMLPSGAVTMNTETSPNAKDALPADARLVWAP